MKLLMALSRFPFPLDKGDKLRAYHQLKFLGERHEVHVVCISEEKVSSADMSAVESHCASLQVIGLTKWQSRTKVLGAALTNKPYQVAYFQSALVRNTIKEVIKQHNIDLCYFQLIRMGENIPFDASCAFYLDYMDAFSSNMERRLPYYSGLKKSIFESEAKRVASYEREILAKVGGACFIAAGDAAVLSDASIDVIPNGVDESFFETGYENRSFDYDLVFTGNMSYHPNVQAAIFLVQEILPSLRQQGLELTVCLAGTSPTSAIKALAGSMVTVTGRVPDLKPYLRSSRLFVAPLFSGSGLQNKLLESMAMSLPTLSTPLANQALKAKPSQMLSCTDLDSFCNHIISLIKDEEQAVDLAKNGHAYVSKHFQWRHFNELLEDRLINLVGQS